MPNQHAIKRTDASTTITLHNEKHNIFTREFETNMLRPPKNLAVKQPAQCRGILATEAASVATQHFTNTRKRKFCGRNMSRRFTASAKLSHVKSTDPRSRLADALTSISVWAHNPLQRANISDQRYTLARTSETPQQTTKPNVQDQRSFTTSALMSTSITPGRRQQTRHKKRPANHHAVPPPPRPHHNPRTQTSENNKRMNPPHPSILGPQASFFKLSATTRVCSKDCSKCQLLQRPTRHNTKVSEVGTSYSNASK